MFYLVLILLFVIVLFVAISWVSGVDYMLTNHPNYSGEDLFDEEPVKNTPVKIPISLIKKTPNDAELGKRVRELGMNKNKEI